MGTKYQQRKQAAREKAVNFQNDFENMALSYYELQQITNYFYRLGARYGLLKEFRENGII